MKPTVVKTEAQYREYMDRIQELVLRDPTPDSEEGSELELLSVLVGDFEDKRYVFESPDPVEAVQFRMLEQDLKQVDLIPYFGSRSRVSEFLSRRRPLTVNMIRELSHGLGISASILIQDSTKNPSPQSDEGIDLDWRKFPFKEMASRGWIKLESRRPSIENSIEAVQKFIEKSMGGAKPGVLARRTIRGDAFSDQAMYALTAWQARVLQKAKEPAFQPDNKFTYKSINEGFLKELVALSRYDDGPVKAVKTLRSVGIAVVFEEHLSKTKLDGAAMLSKSGMPVIGLTLRFDRLDNFWFTLLHECVHIWKHLDKPGDVILDRILDKESNDEIEKEANRYARDLLISRADWRSSTIRQAPTRSGILRFAEELNVHPAIVAGRVQKETENYAAFSDMVGRGELKRLFN